MPKTLIGACLCSIVLGACADAPEPDEVGLTRSGGVELIGISGRRLADGDRYRVPLDSDRAIGLGVSTREAMLVHNRGLDPVRIERFEIAPEAGSTAHWRLLAPTRAREALLSEVGSLLPPEGRIDFDVAVTPGTEGLAHAWLILAWRRGDRQERARITLEARAVGASASTGPDPP